jgi:hypothetical protein
MHEEREFAERLQSLSNRIAHVGESVGFGLDAGDIARTLFGKMSASLEVRIPAYTRSFFYNDLPGFGSLHSASCTTRCKHCGASHKALHGTLMIFFVAMPFVIGLMNFVMPLQLGISRRRIPNAKLS